MTPRSDRNYPGMQGLNANESLASRLHDGFVIAMPIFQSEEKQPELQGPRMIELDDDYDTEEEKEKKKAKNKKKYLRKKEKAQAEKVELQPRQSEPKNPPSTNLAATFVQVDHAAHGATTKSSDAEAVTTTSEPHFKLSKRQKKTLLKKTKRSQSTTSDSGSGITSINSDAAVNTRQSTNKSADVDFGTGKYDEDKDGDKGNSNGHGKQGDAKDKDEANEVPSKAEVEAVMTTVAKRFGQ